jgi:predicted anti-sigma-YlaC factor YlaD
MTELLSTSLETRLPRLTRWQMQLHLLICQGCRRYRQQLSFIQQALLQIDQQNPAIKLPDNVKQRIKEHLAKAKQMDDSQP